MTLSRRTFLLQTGSCAAHLRLAALAAPLARATWARAARGPVVAMEPFARLESIGPKIWAVISTPLSGDYTTVSNGGLIAGSDGVLAIEGFMKPEGAAWLAGKAVELTGKRPTHVLLTHFHSDHANGVAGYLNGSSPVKIHATSITTTLVHDRNLPADTARNDALAGAIPVDPTRPTTINLGGRVVHLTPRLGHTPSDTAITVDDPRLIFCGDLVWNGMFPNYVDAAPIALRQAVQWLRNERVPQYVPGHGSMATPADLDRYVDVLDEVERAARAAHERGLSAADGAKAYKLPASLGEWLLFSPKFMEVAFTAWYRTLPA
jgi:glyoxylase-like metal-dependent hydrolase (beta-lactamase superfamily II)